MKMDMEAYCWISRIMGNLQHDMGVYKDEKEDPKMNSFVKELKDYDIVMIEIKIKIGVFNGYLSYLQFK